MIWIILVIDLMLTSHSCVQINVVTMGYLRPRRQCGAALAQILMNVDDDMRDGRHRWNEVFALTNSRHEHCAHVLTKRRFAGRRHAGNTLLTLHHICLPSQNTAPSGRYSVGEMAHRQKSNIGCAAGEYVFVNFDGNDAKHHARIFIPPPCSAARCRSQTAAAGVHAMPATSVGRCRRNGNVACRAIMRGRSACSAGTGSGAHHRRGDALLVRPSRVDSGWRLSGLN